MTSKKISLMEFESNPNIGLYMFANDKFCIIGEEVSKEKKKEIENILNVPIYKLTILGTNLAGVFLAGNNEFLISPQIYDYEQEELEKICKKHDTKLITINNKINTFGNNISIGNDSIIINSAFEKSVINQIEKSTKLKIIKLNKKDLSSAGALCKFLNGKFFISQELDEEDVKEFLNEIAGLGTINSGSIYIASGVVGNSNGLLIGSLSSTIEIQNIVETLNYI